MSWFCFHQWDKVLESNTQLIYSCTMCTKTKEFNVYCKHNWIEKERTVVLPISFAKSTDAEYLSKSHMKFIRKLLSGSTTILYECENCKEHEIIEMIGAPQNEP